MHLMLGTTFVCSCKTYKFVVVPVNLNEILYISEYVYISNSLIYFMLILLGIVNINKI